MYGLPVRFGLEGKMVDWICFDGSDEYCPPLFVTEDVEPLKWPFAIYRDVLELIVHISPDDFCFNEDAHQIWDSTGRVIRVCLEGGKVIEKKGFFGIVSMDASEIEGFRCILKEPSEESQNIFRVELTAQLSERYGVPLSLLEKASLQELVKTLVGVRGYEVEEKK